MPSLAGAFAQGVNASRPAASAALEGYVYFSTDIAGGTLYQCKSSAWVALTPGNKLALTTQDDLLVAGASGVLGRLAKGSDGDVLTVDPSTHHLVWAAPAAGYTDPTTTNGDLLTRAAGIPSRLGIGSTGDVLTVAAGAPSWAAPAGGGGGAMVQITKIGPLGSAQAAFDFTSISGSYNALRLLLIGKSTDAAVFLTARLVANNDGAGTSYINNIAQNLNGTETSALQTGVATALAGYIAGAGGTAGYPGQLIIDCVGYAGTTFVKVFKSLSGAPMSATDTYAATIDNTWKNTAAITRLTLTLSAGNWDIGSMAILYGIT